MEDKVGQYTGRTYLFKNYLKNKWESLKSEESGTIVKKLRRKTGDKVQVLQESAISHLNGGNDMDYSHIYRKKTRMEMVRISAAVMGIEFCYAAETAFVSPTLLKIGVRHVQMTLIWCLSPFVGFFLTPILGSLSDNCTSSLGRRRPFIILLSIGIILGLILVPNGRDIGISLGDDVTTGYHPSANVSSHGPLKEFYTVTPTSEASIKDDLNMTILANIVHSLPEDVTLDNDNSTTIGNHQWGVFFTIVGILLLDFNADACQSPSRAYLLDVTLPEDHARGLTTFTIMAGLGGCIGYAMGAINWDVTIIGWLFGGHVRAVFTTVTFIFIGCIFCTLYSFREIPLKILQSTNRSDLELGTLTEVNKLTDLTNSKSYGTVGDASDKLRSQNNAKPQPSPNESSSKAPKQETSFNQEVILKDLDQVDDLSECDSQMEKITLRQYLMSIIFMPKALRILCLTNLFCWMSLVCYSLYFTDFVGEAVFGGDPLAADGSELKKTYEEGVRFGCWGMALYSLSCSAYSFIIEKLVKKFRARIVYICGQLVYSVGMICMAVLRRKAAVIVFSCSAGIMYSTLFTMPYLLVAHYHATGTFDKRNDGSGIQIRGLGTDVAIISSMVFLAQFILSLCMGTIVSLMGTTTAVVCTAALLAFFGAISATQVLYLDL